MVAFVFGDFHVDDFLFAVNCYDYSLDFCFDVSFCKFFLNLLGLLLHFVHIFHLAECSHDCFDLNFSALILGEVDMNCKIR